jgi:hypothetical protein
LKLPSKAIDELAKVGKTLLPDVPEANVYKFHPKVDLPPEPSGLEVLIDSDDDDSKAAPAIELATGTS